MLTAQDIQKNSTELKLEKVVAEVLVLKISYNGFEAVSFTKAPHTVTKIAEEIFKDPVKQSAELSDLFLEFVNENGFCKTNYKNVLINWSGNHFTLVPSSFYDSEKAKEMLEFNELSIPELLRKIGKVFWDDVGMCVDSIHSLCFVFSVSGCRS